MSIQHRNKPKTHPLRSLFYANRYSENAGMNWLQDRGHISDNCVTPEDVAPCDVKAVMEKADAMLLWTLPPWHNPHPFSPTPA